MSKFFVDKKAINIDNITITGSDTEHIRKVLRMEKGNKIILCDKEGTDYNCIIDKIDKDKVECSIISSAPSLTEPFVKLTLFQCIPKAGKMEHIIQKAVELGAYKIVPVLSHRCVAKGEKKERWQKISAEAAKQCNRGIIPEVADTVDFKTAAKMLCENELSLMPYEAATSGTLSIVKPGIKSVGIIIGPEGGFEESEVTYLEDLGANIVTLGKRILRTETAGSAVIAIVMNLLNEMC
ncbi:MAG: RsmE family RNA methyltransferase [Bacillota bacterium]|nr:RsmE family RNA methyltransferase [Bacillota bacterium]